jgi:EAL domain-containing protein (putative c-di-GMP-specific phosphodiesterase class I)
MAHSLGMKVAAKGVETQELVDAQAALGCNEIQGYISSKPLRVSEFDDWCLRFGRMGYSAASASSTRSKSGRSR